MSSECSVSYSAGSTPIGMRLGSDPYLVHHVLVLKIEDLWNRHLLVISTREHHTFMIPGTVPPKRPRLREVPG